MAEIIGVIVGGALAITGGLTTKLWEGRRERHALAQALAGEIGAIVDVVRRRDYQSHVRELMQRTETTHQPWAIHVSVAENYFTVYEANAIKVGLLPWQAARDVARFYTLAKAIVEDVAHDNIPRTSEADALRRLKQLDDLLTTLIALGDNVVKELVRVC